MIKSISTLLLACFLVMAGSAMHESVAPASLHYYILGNSGGVYKDNVKIDSGYEARAIDAADGHYYILGNGGGVYKDNVKIDSGYEGIDIAVATE